MGRFSTDPPEDRDGPSEDDQCVGCGAEACDIVHRDERGWWCAKCAWHAEEGE